MPPYGIAQFYDQIYDNDPLKDFIDIEDIIASQSMASTPRELGFVESATPIYEPISPANFDTSYGVANEADQDQVAYLGFTPNRFQKGVGSLVEFLQKVSPIANIARGLNALGNRIDTNRAIKKDVARDTQGAINQVVSPRIMNIQPTNQDRGRGNIQTRSAPSKPRSSSYSSANMAFARGR